MDFKNKSDLIKKYWEGQTSLAEEQQLKEYFSSEEGRLEATAVYFQQLADFSKLEMPQPLEESLFQEKEKKTTLAVRSKQRRFSIRNIAAAIAFLLFSLTTFQVWKYQKAQSQKALAARVAFEQARQSLLLVSSKLNKGTSTTTYHLQKFSTVQKKIRGGGDN